MEDKREIKVQVEHLVKKFDDLLVLDDVSFDVKKENSFVLLGLLVVVKVLF